MRLVKKYALGVLDFCRWCCTCMAAGTELRDSAHKLSSPMQDTAHGGPWNVRVPVRASAPDFTHETIRLSVLEDPLHCNITASSMFLC